MSPQSKHLTAPCVRAEQQLVPQYVEPAEPSAIQELPAEVRDGFAQVLAALTGSKVRPLLFFGNFLYDC